MDLQTLEVKTAKRPRSPAFALLASEYLKTGSVSKAKQACLKGLEIFPSYVGARVMLAKCLAAEKDYTSALEHLKKALVIVPDSQALLGLKKEWERALSGGPPAPGDEAAAAAPPVEPRLLEAAPGPPPTMREALPPAGEKPPAPPIEPRMEAVAREHPVESGPPVPGSAVKEKSPEPPVPAGTEESGVGNLEARISGSKSLETLPDIMEIPFMGSPREAPVPVVEPPGAVSTPASIPPEESPKDSAPPAEITGPKQTDRPEVDYEGRIVSKTLAEIYAQQGEFAEAILTYQLLKYKRPELTAQIDNRIRELQDMLSSKSGG